jgi:hypothetical protein
MKTILKVQSVALILLLLCSVCIAPVIAADKQSNVVEDGVHLIKLDTSPTKLDPQFYKNMDVSMNFVVDGNQFYWVRIGDVKAKELSTNDVAHWLCYGAFASIAMGADGTIGAAAFPPSIVAAPPTFGGSMVLYAIGVGAVIVLIDGIIAKVALTLCPSFEKTFVAKNYQTIASDGTILIGIAKTNTAGIAELKKDSLDITKLTHLNKDNGQKQNL